MGGFRFPYVAGIGPFGVADAVQLDAGTATYTGPAHYAQDYLGVWRYRHTNVPPMVGARLAYNWMSYSDQPALWPGVGSNIGASGNTWAQSSDTDPQGKAILSMAVTTVPGDATKAGPYMTGPIQAVAWNSTPPMWDQQPAFITSIGERPCTVRAGCRRFPPTAWPAPWGCSAA